jgi:DUF971 family protein
MPQGVIYSCYYNDLNKHNDFMYKNYVAELANCGLKNPHHFAVLKNCVILLSISAL